MRHADLITGDILIADDGFNCLSAGQQCKVRGEKSQRFVDCSNGRHYLDGQEAGEFDGTANDEIVGFLYPWNDPEV